MICKRPLQTALFTLACLDQSHGFSFFLAADKWGPHGCGSLRSGLQALCRSAGRALNSVSAETPGSCGGIARKIAAT
jgi:hypothetical protein